MGKRCRRSGGKCRKSKRPKLPSVNEDVITQSCNNDDNQAGPSTSSGRGYYQPPTTPFELPHIFREILNYLPVKDWATCRRVSKDWYGACSNVRLNKKIRMVIPNGEKLMYLVDETMDRAPKDIPNIYEDVELPIHVSIDDVPMRSFLTKFGHRIKHLIVPAGWSIEGLQNILFQNCHNLEELLLKGVIPRGKRLVAPGSEQESKVLPNLKKIALEIVNAHSELPLNVMHVVPPGLISNAVNPSAHLFIIDLLGLAPNLEWVQCPNRRDMKDNPSIAATLSELHGCRILDIETSFNRVNHFLAQKLFSGSHDSNPKLSRLDLYLRLNTRGMEKLGAKGYPVESVDLHVRNVDKRGLQDLLPKLGKTLKRLRLTVDTKFQFDFNCRFLSKLESLHLGDYGQDLLFIGDIPQLKYLILDGFNSNLFLKTTIPIFAYSKIESLTLVNLSWVDQYTNVLKKLSTSFPRLSKLSVDNVTDTVLQKIYDCLPHLKELSINCTRVSNTGISGITHVDTEKILAAGYEMRKYHEYEEIRRLPFIADLKDLRSLTIKGQLSLLLFRIPDGITATTLQSLWILHGICLMPNLNSLCIHDATLSSIEVKQLVRTMNLCRLECVNCRIDTATLVWLKKKRRAMAFDFINRK